MSSRGQVAGSLFLTQVSVAVIGLPITILLARNLGAEDYGQFQFVNRVALVLVSIFCFGFPHSVAWYTSSETTIPKQKSLLRLIMLVSSLGGVATAGCLIGFAQLSIVSNPEVWLLMSSFGLFNLISANLVNFSRGLLDISGIGAIKISQVLSWGILIGCFVVTDQLSVKSAVIAAVAAQAVSVGVALLRLRSRKLFSGEFEGINNREIFSFALHTYPGLALRDINVYAGQILIGIILAPRELGIYSVALSLVATLGIISGPINNTVQPFIQRSSSTELRDTVVVSLGASLIVVGLPAIVMSSLSTLLVPLLFGSQYNQASSVIGIICVSVTLDALAMAMYGVLLGMSLPKKTSLATSTMVMTNLVFLAVLVLPLGIYGAAISTVLANLVAVTMMFLAIRKKLELPAGRLISMTFRSLPSTGVRVVRSAVGRLTR